MRRRAKVPLDDRQKLWMALDCARGMHYLHSCRPPIVHGGSPPELPHRWWSSHSLQPKTIE